MLFLLFVYLQMIFFYFCHKQIWTAFINMVTVEANLMSLVCWNLKVFLQCGLSPGKQPTKYADGLLRTLECTDTSSLLKKKKKKKKKPLLACKNWTSHLECLQPHIPMCTYNWSYFEVLNHRIHDVSLRLKKKKFCVSKLPPAFVFLCAFDFEKFRLAFFFLEIIIFFFHFYYEKRRKFAVLEEFKHVGAQKTCKIPFDFWKYGSWDFSVIFGFGCAWRQRPIEVKKIK